MSFCLLCFVHFNDKKTEVGYSDVHPDLGFFKSGTNLGVTLDNDLKLDIPLIPLASWFRSDSKITWFKRFIRL